MLKLFSFLLFHFTCNDATGEWRSVELNGAHFRRKETTFTWLPLSLHPSYSRCHRHYQAFQPLPAWFSLILIHNCFELLVKNTEHRYECDNKRWVNRCRLVSVFVCFCLCLGTSSLDFLPNLKGFIFILCHMLSWLFFSELNHLILYIILMQILAWIQKI